MHPVLFLLFGIVILIVFSGGYTFFVACRRGAELDWLNKEQLDKTPYGRYHAAVVETDQWLKQHEVQDAYIRNREGLRLHALWIPAKNAKGTILLVHGYRSSYLLDFAAVIDGYHQLGFNLLIPDQRGHRKSEGKYITFGVKESEDILDWMQYHNQTNSMLPLILHGVSMGASTILYLADSDLPSNVCGMVADCGFTSPKEIITRVYRRMIKLPAAPSIWAADLFARIFAHFGLTQKDTRKALKYSKVPVLMIHGMADDFVPYTMTRQAYEACTSEKQLLLVADASHGVSFLKDPVGYTSAVFYFLKRRVEQFHC